MIQLQNCKNLKEVMAQLGDESECRAYMEEMRWNGNPICPHCGEHKPYKLADGKTYRCRAKTCKKDFTVTVGTVFENSKVRLSTWIAATYVLSAHKKGISSCQLARDLGITQKTAWFVLHRLRLIMGNPEPEKLNEIVEVDETYVGGTFANMNRGRRKKWQESGRDNKIPIMGLLARGGKAKLTVIGNHTFKDVVRAYVNPSAVIVTDTHLSYQGLDMEYAGHHTVNHSQQEYKRGIYYTNLIEGFFSLFKRTILGTYHQVSPKHLHRYCAESSHRYNTRKVKDKERFSTVLANTKGRLKYKELISNQ
ncbi:MAG TPA: IS1595 family transposase [Puia sp.]|jgi:transposase-like protein|nr:IS1595 family transposase [Puia sp.]